MSSCSLFHPSPRLVQYCPVGSYRNPTCLSGKTHIIRSRYLSENLTPEWKRAYIDYRACKKAIKVISQRLGDVKVQHGQDDEAGERDSSDGDDDAGPSAPPRKTTSPTTFNRAGGSVRSAGSSRGKIGTPGLKRNSVNPSPNLLYGIGGGAELIS